MKQSKLIQIPFPVSSRREILWSNKSNFIDYNEELFEDEIVIPVYKNIAIEYREQIIDAQESRLEQEIAAYLSDPTLVLGILISLLLGFILIGGLIIVRLMFSEITLAQHSGLGLAISSRLLKDQGGDIKYMPRNGGGSIFPICFPRE